MFTRKVLFLFDLLAIAAGPYLALFVRYDFRPDMEKISNLLPYTMLCVPIAAICFLVVGVHRLSWRHISLPDAGKIGSGIAATIALACLISFFFGWIELVPRSVPPLQAVLSLLLMLAMRMVARIRVARRQKRNAAAGETFVSARRHVLIVGMNHAAELYVHMIRQLSPNGVVIEGVLDERPMVRGRLLQNLEVLGHPRELGEILATFKVHCVEIDSIVVAMPFQKLSPESRSILLALERSGAVALDMFIDRITMEQQRQATVDHNRAMTTDAEPKPGLRQQIPPISPTYIKFKRVFDAVCALVLGILLAPLIAIAALLVAIDLGFPVIFWQQRPGLNGAMFRVFKFRTMGPGHDRNGLPIPDDRRLSAIGKFLRRSRLDELPQLYHILVGEMSFVGPRPLMSMYQPVNAAVRFMVRPGVTGWAQVNGGDALTAEEKLVLDVWYLRRASMTFDLKILWRTLAVAIKGDAINHEAISAARQEAPEFCVETAMPDAGTASQRQPRIALQFDAVQRFPAVDVVELIRPAAEPRVEPITEERQTAT
jgi:lipopolysaccharide/colanic/teichoic acid biosynthesis glycosyltransferase